jgi:hypothetical protein
LKFWKSTEVNDFRARRVGSVRAHLKEMALKKQIMTKEQNLLDRIDAVKANSVSEEEFKAVWGINLDEHMKKMMDFVREFDAQLG